MLVVAVAGAPDHCEAGTATGEVMLAGAAAPTQAKSTSLPVESRSITATWDAEDAVQLMFDPK